MKKIRRIIVILLLLMVAFMVKKVNASTSSTVYTGEIPLIEKIEDIEIVSNEVNVDVNTSKVTNQLIIKNIKNEDLVTKITAKLEDKKTGFSIKDLVIKVNNLEIKNIEKEEDNYIFNVKIKSNEYEKIEINYTTENDLKNAKAIKYSLDNYKGKKVKKFNIDLTIPEEDIPLVKKIYPECYDFNEESKKISVCYYDFTINNLTKDFIVQKETWNNLIYGEDVIKDDLQAALYKNARELMSTDLDVKWDRYIVGLYLEGDFVEYRFDENRYIANYFNIKIPEITEDSYSSVYSTPLEHDSILSYVIYKQAKYDNLKTVKDTIVAKYDGVCPLTKNIVDRYSYSDANGNIVDKKICIDYVRSEGDKELYIGSRRFLAEPPKRRFDEFELLIKRDSGEGGGIHYWYGPEYTYRTINIGLDINGNEIDATEEEKVEFINKIGADLYIRKVIYDGNTKMTFVSEWDGEEHEGDLSMVVAYYTDKNKEIANSYLGEKSEWVKVLKFENEIVSNNSKVPTIVSSVGYRTIENGKYMINFFGHYAGRFDALGYIGEAINTNDAKALIQENNTENENIKQQVENEIKSIKIADDKEEYSVKSNEKIIKNDTGVIENNNKINLSNNEKIFIAILGVAIIINILIIIIKKRGKKNGK